MAGRRGGGGRSRMDLRRESDAVEAREGEEVVKDEEAEDEDEDEDAEDDEAEVDDADLDGDAEADPEADEAGDDDDDDEDSPKPKKKAKAKAKKAPAKAKAPAKKRTRAVKEVRQKAVWVVFDNGGKRVGVFPFAQKADAEQLLADKIEEKKTTFYVQLVKEPIEE